MDSSRSSILLTCKPKHILRYPLTVRLDTYGPIGPRLYRNHIAYPVADKECALLKMISGKSSSGGNGQTAAPATGTKGKKGKGGSAKKGKGKGSNSSTKTSAADRLVGYKNKGSKPDQPFCWKFNNDKCQHKAKDCKFNHCSEEKAFQKKQKEQKSQKTVSAPPAPHSSSRPGRPL